MATNWTLDGLSNAIDRYREKQKALRELEIVLAGIRSHKYRALDIVARALFDVTPDRRVEIPYYFQDALLNALRAIHANESRLQERRMRDIVGRR